MSNVKFTQLPDQGALTDATIVPTVASGVNYTVTGANLKTYVNSTTGNVTGGNLLTGGQVTAAGNVTGAYIIGNGSLLTGLPATYGNANVSNYLASGTNGANIVTQANVAGAYVIADGSALTNLTGAAISGTISVAGNITGAYLKGNISAATGGYGNSNVQLVLQTYSGTLTAATVSATGNITAANINGNLTGSGAALTGIPTSIVAGTGISVSGPTGAVTITNNNPTPYTNTNVAAFLPTYTGNLTAGNASISGTVTGTHLGNGGGLTNVVTSIVAGSGISINASTGAVTVTATGGGGSGTSIANGTSSVSIPVANGNIYISPTLGSNYTVMGNLVLFNSTASFTTNNLASGITTTIDGTGSTFGARVLFTTNMRPPIYSTTTKPTTGNYLGDTISISNSPTYAGKLAYWCTTGTPAWRYVADDTAV